MPEFIMEGRDHAARAESEFVLGFIEALFFTECSPAYDSAEWLSEECQTALEEGQAGGTIPGDVGYADLHPDSLAAIHKDCDAWQAANAELLAEAYARDYDAAQAGRDYWFTRNGHGVGFWDREELDCDSDEYEKLTQDMIIATDSGDNAAWGEACAARSKLNDESIGNRLTAACRYNEVDVSFDGESVIVNL